MEPIEHTRLVRRLYRRGISNITFRQSKSIGDCYFLAALDALSRHPAGRYYIEQMIHRMTDGNYQVTFPGLPSQKLVVKYTDLPGEHIMVETKLDNGKVFKVGDYISALKTDDMGVRILERAYGQLRQQRFQSVLSPLICLWIGYGHEALAHMTGGTPQQRNTYSPKRSFEMSHLVDYACQVLDKLASNPEQYVVTASTLKEKGNYGDGGAYLDSAHRFIPGHAYSIREIDKAHKTLVMGNPHNNASPLQVSYHDFMEFFQDISYVKLPRQRLLAVA